MGQLNRSMRLAFLGCLCLLASSPAVAQALPPRFTDTTAFTGLTSPTAIAFAPDGQVFVAEKSGLIKLYSGLDDTTATVFADLRTEVHNLGDRGLLGMVLDPQFPSRPYVYVSYVYDAEIGGTAPRWGTPGQSSDPCPTPPGPTADGCIASGRLSRLTASGDTASAESVLINDWCQQYWSHSIGDLAFGADGSLYMSAGDAASYSFTDYGQRGDPLNPCGDPPAGIGGVQTPPTAEGGSLRVQDMQTTGDPLGLDGTVIRVDPDTGRPIPDLPGETDQSVLNEKRIVAYGFRNPYRIAVRPGTNEVWAGDVGWSRFEEIDRIMPGTTGNFGWPCVEGNGRPASWESLRLNLCTNLYESGDGESPYFTYDHAAKIDPGDPCATTNGSSLSGLEFYEPNSGSAAFPTAYDRALFFADYARDCMWVMPEGTNGLPDPSRASHFGVVAGPVDLEFGPDGALYYAALGDYSTPGAGSIHRIAYESDNRAPVAGATAAPDHGVAPLTVQLDAGSSSDPDPGDQLTYAWDLDGDDEFDDSTAVDPVQIYEEEGSYRPRVRVTDQLGSSSTAEVRVSVGSPPVPVIESPAVGDAFAGNETFHFSGSATDAKDGSIPAGGLDWRAVLNHCLPGGGCHEHPVEGAEGVSEGELAMPAHERPYYLTLSLTAHDSDGLEATTSIDIYPTANAAPSPKISTPEAGAGFSAGEIIDFSGNATDLEDGELPPSALSWRLIGVDCPIEPCIDDQPLATGSDHGQFLTPIDPTPYQLQLELTATDSEGASAKTSTTLSPRVVRIMLDSRRDGARVSIGDRKRRTPFTLQALRGGLLLIGAPQSQHAPGYGRRAKLSWRSWSDGGPRIHFVKPLRDRTYRADFKLKRPGRNR